ncbi:Salicylate hydroxylase [Staphylococcus gallinarum]|uniref:Salicylate hydroxylase n=1 Tax=Staphylococcus gallinarum TaxID=1293 RepID=A0A380FKN0_STAGA|nr:Salicylate hydroxylase [Staphylococcus gallinarum]
MMKIGIVGAGIGGLTTAALLIEQGHDVKVFEQKQDITEIGAGIGIGAMSLKS